MRSEGIGTDYRVQELTADFCTTLQRFEDALPWYERARPSSRNRAETAADETVEQWKRRTAASVSASAGTAAESGDKKEVDSSSDVNEDQEGMWKELSDAVQRAVELDAKHTQCLVSMGRFDDAERVMEQCVEWISHVRDSIGPVIGERDARRALTEPIAFAHERLSFVKMEHAAREDSVADKSTRHMQITAKRQYERVVDECIHLLTDCLDDVGDHALLLFTRGTLYMEQENYREASEDLQQVLELDVSNHVTLIKLGDCFFNLREFSVAIGYFEEYLLNYSDHCAQLIRNGNTGNVSR